MQRRRGEAKLKTFIIVALIAAIVGAIACTGALASTSEAERVYVPREVPEPEVEEPEVTEPEGGNAPREPTECPETNPEDEQSSGELESEEDADVAPEETIGEGPPADQLSGTAMKVKLYCTEEVLDNEEAYQAAGIQTEGGEQIYLFLYKESEGGQIDLIVEGRCEAHKIWWQDSSGCWQSQDLSERASEEDSEDMNYFFCIPEDVVFGEAIVWIDCSEPATEP